MKTTLTDLAKDPKNGLSRLERALMAALDACRGYLKGYLRGDSGVAAAYENCFQVILINLERMGVGQWKIGLSPLLEIANDYSADLSDLERALLRALQASRHLFLAHLEGHAGPYMHENHLYDELDTIEGLLDHHVGAVILDRVNIDWDGE